MAAILKALLSGWERALVIVVDEDTSGVNSDGLTLGNALDSSESGFGRQTEGASHIVRLASRDQADWDTLPVWTRQHTVDHLVESSITTNSDKGIVSVEISVEGLSIWVKILFAHDNLVTHVLGVKQLLDLFSALAGDIWVEDDAHNLFV